MSLLLFGNGAYFSDLAEDIEDYDALNSDNYRNDDTQDTDEYNCFGYALETYNWGTPLPTFHDLKDALECDYISKAEYNKICSTIAKEMHQILKEQNADSLPKKAFNLLFKTIMWDRYNDTVALELAKRHMLSTFPNLRELKAGTRKEMDDQLEANEYIIAFAATAHDFHFAKREKGDFWSHKIGRLDIEDGIANIKDIFGDRYPSKIFYFAKKRNDVCA